jgi:hypothetical protein
MMAYSDLAFYATIITDGRFFCISTSYPFRHHDIAVGDLLLDPTTFNSRRPTMFLLSFALFNEIHAKLRGHDNL